MVEGSTLQVNFEDGRVGFSADCNGMSADYEVVDGRLELRSEVISTMMGCEQALMDQDQWLTDFFAGEPRVTAADEQGVVLEGEQATIELSETG